VQVTGNFGLLLFAKARVGARPNDPAMMIIAVEDISLLVIV
jgi:hypothetical protein